MNNVKKGVLLILMPFLVSISFLISCSKHTGPENSEILYPVRTGGVVIADSTNQLKSVWQSLQVVDTRKKAYGIDFRNRRVFVFCLESGDLAYIGGRGRGPREMLNPVQISVKNEHEIYVYDSSLDLLAHIIDDEISEKIPGFLIHEVWLRHTYGFFWNNHLITSIEDPASIQSMNFDDARPLAMLNLDEMRLSKHGRISPGLARYDTFDKYPLLAMDKNRDTIYYVFHDDYTVMRHSLTDDSSSVASLYKPQKMRIRSMSVDLNNPEIHSREFSNKLQLDRSVVVGLEVIEDNLVVVWQNATEQYLSNRHPDHLDFFGVMYDLPHLSNPREFSLPGKLLGRYGNSLLIEENDDPVEYTIGFYELLNENVLENRKPGK